MEVKEYIESFGYKLLDDKYIDNKTKLNMLCPNGHLWSCNLRNFKIGRRCRTCSYILRGNNQKLKYEDVKNYIQSKGYELLSTEYFNNSTKLQMKCEKGHIFEMEYSSFQQNKRCPKCGGVYRYNYDEVKEYFNSFGYDLISKEYKDANTALESKCPEGHILKCSFSSFNNRNTRCHICNEKLKSKGEKIISDFLNRNNMQFSNEYTFKDCRGKKRVLPFDFYLPEYNICIEFDGKQHYRLDSYNHRLLDLMNRKYVDDIKTSYCKENKIKLIRIPFWDVDNIEEILNRKIS